MVAGGPYAWNIDGSSILSCGVSDRQLGCRCCRNTFCLGQRRESLGREGRGRKVLKGTLGGWWLNAQADLYVQVECRKANCAQVQSIICGPREVDVCRRLSEGF